MNYDPWGARRKSDGETDSLYAPYAGPPGRREFTGHEAMHNVGLINMNGRLYDPTLGRFMAPDPNVQFVADLQSYNRYSYVLNNPLRHTDPTGYNTADDNRAINWGLTFVGVACSFAIGPECGAGVSLLATGYNVYTAINSGAQFDSIMLATFGSIVLSAAGGAIGSAIGGGLGYIVGGAISGVLSGAYSSLVSNSSLGLNVFEGAVEGAVMAGFSLAANVAHVSQAEADGAEGEGLSDDPGKVARANAAKVKALAIDRGQVTNGKVGALPVEVYGRDASDRSQAFAGLKQDLTEGGGVASSVRQALSNRLLPGGGGLKPLEIILTGDYGSYAVPGSNTIVVDVLSDVDSLYDSVRPGGHFTYQRILAHELGHAALGLQDLTTDPMLTVRQVENPIMRALGDTNDRQSYNWELR
jgi:RHS repeat-associated protein